MPPHEMRIARRNESKGRQVVLQILLPSGIANNTTEQLDYRIQDSMDGSTSVLILEGIMPLMFQNPSFVEQTYDEQDKTPDWTRAMQALQDARRDHVTREKDQLRCVARFDLGIKVPATIESQWVHCYGVDTTGER
jgi:hypothetical protein